MGYRIATAADMPRSMNGGPLAIPDDELRCTVRLTDDDDDVCPNHPATATIEAGQDSWVGSARCAVHLVALTSTPERR